MLRRSEVIVGVDEVDGWGRPVPRLTPDRPPPPPADP